jgi:hypothetical protein
MDRKFPEIKIFHQNPLRGLRHRDGREKFAEAVE